MRVSKLLASKGLRRWWSGRQGFISVVGDGPDRCTGRKSSVAAGKNKAGKKSPFGTHFEY